MTHLSERLKLRIIIPSATEDVKKLGHFYTGGGNDRV